MRPASLVPLLSLFATIGCHRDRDETDTAVVTGDGVFAEGCPIAGQAMAREIGVDAKFDGVTAVATRGDFLIANERAAFGITRPDANSTYWYYGGAVADAVALDGCAAAMDDGLDEIGIVLADIKVTAPTTSIVRAFRADTVEVINDGSDGEAAIVRATGTDDMHWLADDELIRSLVEDGGGRPNSPPWGLTVTADYVLEPGSDVLRIELGVTNDGAEDVRLASAALVSFAPEYDTRAYATSTIDLGFFSMETGIPYLAATSGRGAYAYGVAHGNLGHTEIAGIDLSVDLDQALSEPIDLEPGASDSRTTYLAVNGRDSAAAALIGVSPDVLPGVTATATTVTGTVTDADGDAVGGIRVELSADGGEGFGALDVAYSDDTGAFALTVPDMSPEPWSYRVVAHGDGRDATAPAVVTPGGPPLTIAVHPFGEVDFAISDDDGPVPARVALRRDTGERFDRWTNGSSREPLPPGFYTYTVTRGFEYEPATGTITVPDDGDVTLTATLERVVDTDGWISLDTHVHSAWSPDSRMLPHLQTLHGAAHGVDVVVHTEHEMIVDQQGDIALMGLTGRVAQINGQEVTATIPEHMTMVGSAWDGTVRGGPVRWYDLDPAHLFAAMRERTDGLGVNILNHPGYMDLIGWDYVNAVPTHDDPTRFGFEADAELWSWDFDGMEVMNGFSNPFASGNRRFEKWQSLLNAGHRVTATGCSDDHGGDETGLPRVYVEGSDDLANLDQQAVMDAFRDGRAVVSAGAFARVTIEGQGPGALVDTSGNATDDTAIHVHIEAPAAIDVTRAVVFVNCDKVAEVAATAPDGIVKLDTDVPLVIASDSHVTVAAFGTGALPDGLPQFDPTNVPRVLTNAIYVDADGDGDFDAPGGRICAY